MAYILVVANILA